MHLDANVSGGSRVAEEGRWKRIHPAAESSRLVMQNEGPNLTGGTMGTRGIEIEDRPAMVGGLG